MCAISIKIDVATIQKRTIINLNVRGPAVSIIQRLIYILIFVTLVKSMLVNKSNQIKWKFKVFYKRNTNINKNVKIEKIAETVPSQVAHSLNEWINWSGGNSTCPALWGQIDTLTCYRKYHNIMLWMHQDFNFWNDFSSKVFFNRALRFRFVFRFFCVPPRANSSFLE